MQQVAIAQRPVRWRQAAQEALRTLPRFGLVLVFGLCILVFSLLEPSSFATQATLINVLQESAVLAVVSVGLTIPMVQQEFDLSVAYMASVAGVIVVGLMSFNGFTWPEALLVTLGIAAVGGLVNGLVVTGLELSSFIVTLGTGTILTGVESWYNGGQTIAIGIPPEFVSIGRGSVGGLPNLVWIALVVALFAWATLSFTPLGRDMYAIGGNREAARLAGIPISQIRVLGFVLSASLAGLGGIMFTASSGEGYPGASDALLLQAFAACFLGSVTFRDGEFNVPGTIVGVLMLSTIFTGLTTIGLSTYVQSWATGGLLIIAVALSGTARRLLSSRARVGT